MATKSPVCLSIANDAILRMVTNCDRYTYAEYSPVLSTTFNKPLTYCLYSERRFWRNVARWADWFQLFRVFPFLTVILSSVDVSYDTFRLNRECNYHVLLICHQMDIPLV